MTFYTEYKDGPIHLGIEGTYVPEQEGGDVGEIFGEDFEDVRVFMIGAGDQLKDRWSAIEIHPVGKDLERCEEYLLEAWKSR